MVLLPFSSERDNKYTGFEAENHTKLMDIVEENSG